MTNFNPYTGNKRVGGPKKKAKPAIKKMPYSSKVKGSKLKMSSGGEIVDDLTGGAGYSPGTVPRVEEALNNAGVGVEQSGSSSAAKKKAASSATPTTTKKQYNKSGEQQAATGSGSFAEMKAKQDAKFKAAQAKKAAAKKAGS